MTKQRAQNLAINNEFIKETEKIKSLLITTKEELDELDATTNSNEQRERFAADYKKRILVELKRHFDAVWEIVKDLTKHEYRTYRSYYQKHILSLLTLNEVNRHIYTKPFGYSGDYVTMNYIYDYYGKFPGSTSFEKLINNLTCSISISKSNIERKDFLKREILNEIAKNGENTMITSIASGPARELIELLEEGHIKQRTSFNLFDFEKKALAFVKQELAEISGNNKIHLRVNFVNKNVVDIIRKPTVRKLLSESNFIYAFGIYDYLSDIMALKLTRSLFECLRQGGRLIICNASVDKSDLRAYYEFLGEWHMVYRTKEEMARWAEGLPAREISFRDKPDEAYLYLIMEKE
jgi:extracellular factor (EF) 3-hydroxypalmitic acid methyl ester biosynthesis protein